jgi:hypothetical protein
MKAPIPPSGDAQAPRRPPEGQDAKTTRDPSRTPPNAINGPLRVVSRTLSATQRAWATRLLIAIGPGERTTPPKG